MEVEWYLTPKKNWNRNEEPSRLKVAYDRETADFGMNAEPWKPSQSP
jgi:hypothetical protein